MGDKSVAALRTVGGIDRFTVRVDPEPGRRLALPRMRGALRIGLCVGVALAVLAAVVSASPWSASARSVVSEAARRADPAVLPAASDAATKVAPPPPWVDVNHPIPLFDLPGSTFGRLALTYRARRRGDDRERQDVLLYGEFGADAPVFALAVRRLGLQPGRASFFVDMARLAADQALAVVRSDVPTLVPTRFGGFEAADLTVSQDAKTRPCLGFRLQPAADGTAPVAMSGLACGTPVKPMDREGLACVLDRIDLLSAGDDTEVRSFFVDAERRRGQGCAGSGLLAAGSRRTWLDGEAVKPPLKPSGPLAKPRHRSSGGAKEL